MIDQVTRKLFKDILTSRNSQIKSETSDEIVARCPFCGDSKHSANKARLHLYTKFGTPMVNCFNGGCSVNNVPFGKFVNIFANEFYSEYKRAVFRQNLNNTFSGGSHDELANVHKESDSVINSDSSDDLDIFNSSSNLAWLNEYNRSERNTEPDVDLKTVNFGNVFFKSELSNAATNYIKSRRLDNSDVYFCKQNLKIDGTFYKTRDSVVIPLLTSDKKWYGFYSRSIHNKDFSTYINKANSGYKVWNLFNIDYERDVYIFEGIFDAMSAMVCGLQNCVACLGATISDKALALIKKPVYCYDNDKTGILNEIKVLSKNPRARVFVSPLEFKDMNECLLQGINCKDLIEQNILEGYCALIKLQQKL